MVGGFNTNVRHAGRLFHVQTEDSGVRSPKIVTLLYEGGTILTSRKRTYQDRLGEPNLEPIVRELMEDQHRELVRALKAGELDALLGLEVVTEVGLEPAPGRPTAPSAEFGASVHSGRRLDEVVLERLRVS
jgi:hypothetical protein